jgi:DNA-directed RNA polymerase specialized sigma24 family protein
MELAYHRSLETLYQQQSTSLQHWLARRFPRAGSALVEDAVSDAFHDAVARPRPFENALAQGGEAAVMPLLKQVAWRHLRGHLRKKSSQREVMIGATVEPAHLHTPQALALGRELTAHVLALVDQAAALFGGRRRRALRAALHARLAGSTDAEAARAHGVPREYVNRAKSWIRMRLTVS